uniref:Methylisocitrate lyase n=1 Tax=Haptolina brevifila TaxID=156173 RepID=A0A6U7I060_9EUKA|mmetsp:Transcript_56385/g.111947  ORF Transcript_56385/g.111947 Transcript_56385/m.111947 type:complete len:329 (+) Transcript_56385:31-1017(+)
MASRLANYARRSIAGRGSKRLRELLAAPEIVVLPGAFDCFSARLIESEGFNACFVTGQGLSGSLIGRPDYGFLTASETLGAASRICSTVDIPVIADLDTGFGGPLNVFRTVEEAAAAGVAGFILEDQEWPKKCGHMSGRGSTKKVISSAEHASKIAAAAEARGDSDMVLIARTDARAEHGLDEAIRRGHEYHAAGADVIFIEAPQSLEEFRLVRAAFDSEVPLFANVFEGTPYKDTILSAEELQSLGYAMVVYPMSFMFAAVHGMRAKLRELKSAGVTDGRPANRQPMVSYDEYLSVIGLQQFRELEEAYALDESGQFKPQGKPRNRS